jgi:hypothetical protein
MAVGGGGRLRSRNDGLRDHDPEHGGPARSGRIPPVPADSPKKVAHLQTLPARKLIGRTYQGKKYYVYSDPDGCTCLYIGTPEQYQSYQGIVQQLETPPWQATGGVEEAREWEIENSGLQ